MEFRILKKKIGIEKQIDEFLDKVSESGLLFKDGVHAYLKGNMEIFKMKLEQITNTERIGDSLRRNLEERLYRQTLIPESRGDVLELLESMDTLLDQFKGALWRFEIEYPEVCSDFTEDFIELTDKVVASVESMVLSSRAFFKDIDTITDHMHKVSFWEKQSDKISTRLQKSIFQRKDLRLSHRMQIRDFVRHIDEIADCAEDVADRLSIYVIKRSL
jgi:predicted phosphate transport protein (TIGR00153 family)